VVSPDDGQIDAIAGGAGVTVLRCGGATRMDSVQNALRQLGELLRAGLGAGARRRPSWPERGADR
jgi:hypothetical protein